MRRRALSLAEVVVYMVIMGLIAAPLVTLHFQARIQHMRTDEQLTVLKELAVSLDYFRQDVREAQAVTVVSATQVDIHSRDGALVRWRVDGQRLVRESRTTRELARHLVGAHFGYDEELDLVTVRLTARVGETQEVLTTKVKRRAGT